MQTPNEQQLAGLALQFMARVQLQGQEVPAFAQVSNWLQSKMVEQSEPKAHMNMIKDDLPADE